MPTIAITLNTAWNIVNFRGGLVRALVAAGYRVVAIAPEDEFAQQVRDLGATFIPLQRLARKGTNPLQEIRLIRELRGIYRRERVDVALQYTIKPVIYGTIAAQGSRTRIINTITGLGYAFLSAGVVNKVVQRLYRYALVHSDRVFFQNRDDRQLFINRRMVSADTSSIMPGSGINITHFSPSPPPAATDPLRFLFIGRLLTDKGVGELLAAARTIRAEYADVEFHVVGSIDNDNPAAISGQALAENIESGTIVYHGQVTDTREYLRTATAVVLPSYREGLPRVMLEGMAMARPLITTDVPGCRDTVREGENGLLVPVKDADALAEAIRNMIGRSDEQRRVMGEAGRHLAETVFSERQVVARYLTEIDRLLSAAPDYQAGDKSKAAVSS